MFLILIPKPILCDQYVKQEKDKDEDEDGGVDEVKFIHHLICVFTVANQETVKMTRNEPTNRISR